MKIAYLCADFGVPVFGSKGASVHVREMVSSWQSLGHEVVIFSPNVAGAPEGIQEFTAVAVEPARSFLPVQQDLRGLDAFLGMSTRVRHDLRNLLYNKALFAAISPILRSEQFDFVYERYTLFNYAGVALARHAGLPHLLEVNAPLCYEQEKMRGLEMKDLAHELERRVFTETDCLVLVSEQLRPLAESREVSPERIMMLPNGVDPRKFNPEPATGERVRQQLQLNGQTIIGFVGSLKPWHGTETLVAAFEQLRSRTNDVRLLIVGDGPQRQSLADQIQAAGLNSAVTFTGKVQHDEVPAYLSAMDITVAPYTPSENFYFSPIKIYEYMAVGKPVVAGGIGQVLEVIHEGETGLVYEPGNVAQLRDALERLIAAPSLRNSLGKAGREWVVSHRTWRGNAAKIVQVVGEMMSKRKSPDDRP